MDESDELLEKHQDYTTWVMSIKTTPGQLLRHAAHFHHFGSECANCQRYVPTMSQQQQNVC